MSDNNCSGCKTISGSVDEINSQDLTASGNTCVPPIFSPVAAGVIPVCNTQINLGGQMSYCNNGCGCNKPTCGTCCENVQCATPQPYYNIAPLCTEDHQKCIVNNTFTTTLKVDNSWNIPGCAASAVLTIKGLSNILIGSYLYAPLYGYFQVISFNSATAQVTVQNNCTAGNAAVGSTIPACTNFIVTPPPVSSSGGGGVPSVYPYLAVDFTAPANGDCVLITVTTTQGLSVGKNIQIGSGIYNVQSITSSTSMTICNEGLGAIAGTPVLALNSAGELQYPLILIDSNPCTNEPVTQGAIVVCNNNTQQPLSGASAGMVPYLVDPVTGYVEYRLLNVPTRTCTAITCCLTLVPAQAAYTITVGTTVGMTVGDLLQIGTRSDRATITAILNATTLQVTISPVPSVLEAIAPGTSLCNVECCEVLSAEIDALEVDVAALEAEVAVVANPCTVNPEQRISALTYVSGNGAGGTISDGGVAEGPVADMIIANTSSCKSVYVHYTIDYDWEVKIVNGADNESTRVTYREMLFTGTGAIGSVPATAPTTAFTMGKTESLLSASSAGHIMDNSASRSATAIVPPGQEIRVRSSTAVGLVTADSNQLEWTVLRSRITYLAVAI